MMGMDMDLDTDVVPNEGASVSEVSPGLQCCNCGGFLDTVHSFAADGSVNEDVVITKPFGNGQMTCREIRRNSAGCLKFRNECQKCKDIQHVGEPLFLSFFAADNFGIRRQSKVLGGRIM